MKPLYCFCRWLTGTVLRLFFGLDVLGIDNVPPEGGLLIAANHLSFLDPPLIAVAMEREIHFLARKTLFKKGGFGLLLTNLNSIPIDRDRPDMNGLRLVIKRCQEGHAVLIFPESTRSEDGQLQPGQAGAGLVAVKAGVPILPVRISGTFEAWPRNAKGVRLTRLKVAFGPVFRIEPSPRKDKEEYQRAADEIMRRIAALPGNY